MNAAHALVQPLGFARPEPTREPRTDVLQHVVDRAHAKLVESLLELRSDQRNLASRNVRRNSPPHPVPPCARRPHRDSVSLAPPPASRRACLCPADRHGQRRFALNFIADARRDLRQALVVIQCLGAAEIEIPYVDAACRRPRPSLEHRTDLAGSSWSTPALAPGRTTRPDTAAPRCASAWRSDTVLSSLVDSERPRPGSRRCRRRSAAARARRPRDRPAARRRRRTRGVDEKESDGLESAYHGPAKGTTGRQGDHGRVAEERAGGLPRDTPDGTKLSRRFAELAVQLAHGCRVVRIHGGQGPDLARFDGAIPPRKTALIA